MSVNMSKLKLKINHCMIILLLSEKRTKYKKQRRLRGTIPGEQFKDVFIIYKHFYIAFKLKNCWQTGFEVHLTSLV